MQYNLDLSKENLLHALMLASAERQRAAKKFGPGSMAQKELLDQATELHRAADDLKRAPTPLETAIDKTKK